MMNRTVDKCLDSDSSRSVVRWLLSVSLVIYVSLVSFASLAKPITPDANMLVASWPIDADGANTVASLQRVKWHIQQGQYPGKANLHYAQAQNMLARIPKTERDPVEFHYFQARLLQYQHRFLEAQIHLDNLLIIAPAHINGLLLKANLHLVVNDFEKALNTCKRLVGVADLLVATACSLEATSYQPSNLSSSYAVLRNVLHKTESNHRQSRAGEVSETHAWMLQIAADMALRLGEVEQAASWLSVEDLHNQPLSYVVFWAEIQRLLGHHDKILKHLGDIVEQSEFKDDGLLIRLAMAEKALLIKPSMSQWQVLAKQRIDLRIARHDDFHAADIARYYLFVDPQPKLALQWAKTNFTHAKLFDDRILLEQAQSYSQQQGI